MSDKVDLVEREVECISFVDLGDAAEETKQVSPSNQVPDSIYGMGIYTR
jgi:hypothetical protein